MRGDFVHVSESVSAGHPDKLCDAISDAIVDAYLDADPLARVNAECAMANGIVFLAVRFASDAQLDPGEIVRREVARVGYQDDDVDPATLSVMLSMARLPNRSRLPALAVDAESVPAGRLVTSFGFACLQTADLMPLPIWLAHRIARALSDAAKGRHIAGLAPDAVAQVAVRYANWQPVAVDAVSIEAAVSEHAGRSAGLSDAIRETIVAPILADLAIAPPSADAIRINPGDQLEGGGPSRHTGLTGRKTACDLYGGYARATASGLSGKDPWRIDRSAAYAARQAARFVVDQGWARVCEVQLSYRTDLAVPTSLQLATYDSHALDEASILARLREAIDFRPAALARDLGLVGPQRTRLVELAAFGQVGRSDPPLAWEAAPPARG